MRGIVWQERLNVYSHSPCSLIATIKRSRPDLLQGLLVDGEPIPAVVPAKYLPKTFHIEGVGQPSVASFLTKSNTDPTNWCVEVRLTHTLTRLSGGYLKNMTV